LTLNPDGVRIGVQLWTLREACRRDLAATLEALARAGFQWIEPYSFYDVPIGRWQESLGEFRLRLASAHVALDQLENDLDDVMENHARLGCRTIIFHWHDENRRADAADFDRLGALLNRIGERLRAWGFELLYHNHDFEFLASPPPDGLTRILRTSDPANVGAQLDVYWAYAAGNNPVSLIRRLGSRLRSIHLKDGDPKRQTFTPLGGGKLDLPGILNAALDQGVATFILEQDECDGDPIASLARSLAFLRGQGLAR
jgi:sugar phosphate isomerase/epimerase